jgi:RNA polymerase sigma-70 factor (ECF subfamily)
MIRDAADGDAAAGAAFARRYERIVRAYLVARWRSSPLVHEVDDAVQEVFVESFRGGGALARANPDTPGGFRAFLYGVVRNVARRVESRRGRRRDQQPATGFFRESQDASEPRLSKIYDREWAAAVMREAAAGQRARAEAKGPEAQRRVELLRLRFYEGWPIRRIAQLWDADAADLHREYAKARREFRQSLSDVVAFHHPGSAGEVERECARLLEMLE